MERRTSPETEPDAAIDHDDGGAKADGGVPATVRRPAWLASQATPRPPGLTIDSRLMLELATRAIAAGAGGLTKLGVASVEHGEGASTVARSLAICLAERFGQRVVLVDANQRSPCLRGVCGLSPGPGLEDVLSGASSLEAALRVLQPAGNILVLPSSAAPSFNLANMPVAAWNDLAAELFIYAGALVMDLAPLLPYPDTFSIGRALDGLVLVMQARRATRAGSTRAVEGLKRAGIPVIGAVLNREKRFVPQFLERLL